MLPPCLPRALLRVLGLGLTLALAAAARALDPTAGLPAQLRVVVLDCGAMRGVDAAPFLPGVADRPQRVDLVDRCYLVEHPHGRLLWDTGFPDTRAFRVQRTFYWLTSLGRSEIRVERSLLDQLADRGLAPHDIDYLALSHVHLDHAGAANHFDGATWLVQRAERDWAFSPDLHNPYVKPALYEKLREAKTVLLDGDHDVFGDGSVVILSAPGHTPGHQCLFLDLPKTGPVILSGDLYHTHWNREHRVAPEFNVDRDETLRSMERIERIAKERGAQIWIQHDPSSGPAAPAVVE
jgi:N-acyl homoserine lactone hydrolase